MFPSAYVLVILMIILRPSVATISNGQSFEDLQSLHGRLTLGNSGHIRYEGNGSDSAVDLRRANYNPKSMMTTVFQTNSTVDYFVLMRLMRHGVLTQTLLSTIWKLWPYLQFDTLSSMDFDRSLKLTRLKVLAEEL